MFTATPLFGQAAEHGREHLVREAERDEGRQSDTAHDEAVVSAVVRQAEVLGGPGGIDGAGSAGERRETEHEDHEQHAR